jgi:hypothetical protein
MADMTLQRESISKPVLLEFFGIATDQLVHSTSDHVLSHDDRAGDGEDGAILVFT